MAVFTHDCPHCSATRATFLLGAAVSQEATAIWSAVASCPACHGPILIVMQALNSQMAASGPVPVSGDLAKSNPHFVIIRVWPEPEATVVPLHVPERVGRAFKEGCDVLRLSPSSACAQFRKALEWGLKDLAPEVEAWKLEKRIDKLAADGKLTQSLKDWAHQLRIDGNEAVHGEEDPTREHAQAIEQLTRYVLTYLYTLPKSIELARAADGK